MEEKKWVEIGDIVRVYWEHIEYLEGKLIACEQQEGAYCEYSIKDKNGILHSVLNYCRMSVIKKKAI